MMFPLEGDAIERYAKRVGDRDLIRARLRLARAIAQLELDHLDSARKASADAAAAIADAQASGRVSR